MAEWPPSVIVGPEGPVGPQGATGPSGPQGTQGTAGLKGDKGDTGDAGPAGPQGVVGPAGSQGPAGPQGEPGIQGPDGQGTAGDQGPAGPQGEVGPIGPAGPQGVAGPTGPAGAQGLTGATGAAGAQGVVGPTGPAGSQGPAGVKGDTGLKGDTGDVGPAGAAGAVGPAGAQGPTGQVNFSHVRQYKAANFSVINPAVTPVLSGTFTPDTDTVWIDVFPNFRVLEIAGCHVGVYLFVGPTGIGQLTPVKLGGVGGLTQAYPTASGISKYRLGAVGAHGSDGVTGIAVGGLTPGVPVAFEVALVVIGYAASLPLPAGPYSVDVAANNVLASTSSYKSFNWIAVANGANVTIVKADHTGFYYEDSIYGTAALGTGTWVAGRCRITPNATRVLLTSQFDTHIAIVTTGVGTGAVPALQAQYTVPNGGGTYGAAISPDGLTGYVCIVGGTDSGKVIPVTLATGVFGTPISLGQGTAGLGWDAVVDSTGTYLYVALHQTNAARVVRVKLSDGSITTLTLSTTAGAFAHSLALSPDGVTLFVGGATSTGNHRVWKIPTATFTNSGNFTVTGGQPIEGIDVFADNAGVIMAKSETVGSAQQGTATNQIHHHLVAGGEYTTWMNSLTGVANSPAYDISVGPNGAIYVGDNAGSKLNIWFGGQAWQATDSDFWMAETRARVVGAT